MYSRLLKFLLFILLPITAFAGTQWSNWNEITLGNFNAYSNVVAKDPTHAYVVLSSIVLPTDTNKHAQAYLYTVDLTNSEMSRASIESLAISDYVTPMNLVLDNNGVPYVAYMSFDQNTKIHQISVVRLKVDGSWEVIGNNISIWNKDSDKDNRIKILCDPATNDIYLFFVFPDKDQHKKLGIRKKQENGSGVSWQPYAGNNNQITNLLNYNVKNTNNGNFVVAYTTANTSMLDLYMYDINVTTYNNQQNQWSQPSVYDGINTNKVYLDIDYNGSFALSYASPLSGISDRQDGWITLVNGQWIDALKGNYAKQGLRSPQWFTDKKGGYISSYIALSTDDQKFHYYSQIYDPINASWSTPIPTTATIGRQFNTDYADTSYYDKTNQNNNLFVMVETEWPGNGKNFILAERHALSQ